MGRLHDIVAKHEISTEKGFSDAMKEAANVSEGELRFVLSFDLGAQSPQFRQQHALARAELDRRAFKQQESLARMSAYFGLFGVIVGALMTTLATWALHDLCRGLAAALCGPEAITIEEAAR